MNNTTEEKNVSSEDSKIKASKFKLPSFSVKQYKFAVIIFSVLSIALSAFRIYTIKKSIGPFGFLSGDSSYRLSETVYTKVFLALYFVAIFAALVIGILSKGIRFGVNKRSNGFVFVSSLAGFCMVGCAGFFVYRSALMEAKLTNIEYLVVILMLFSGVFFAMDAVGFVTKKTRPWFTVGVTLFGAVRLLSEFLALHDQQYYSSNEYHLVSLAVILVFFCCNARFNIEGTAGVGYPFFGLFSAFSLLVYAVPEIYISFFEPRYVDSVFIFCVVDVVLAFYVVSKLMSVKENSVKNVSQSSTEKI